MPTETVKPSSNLILSLMFVAIVKGLPNSLILPDISSHASSIPNDSTLSV